MRLIDIDPINKDLTLKKRVLTAKYGEYAAEDGSYMSWREIFELVNRQPEADAVKVVRCKDCRWYDKVDWCNKLRISGVKAVEETWFCAEGERKDDAVD